MPWKDVTAEFEWPSAPKLSLAVPGEESQNSLMIDPLCIWTGNESLSTWTMEDSLAILRNWEASLRRTS